jgi:hypothetical protein
MVIQNSAIVNMETLPLLAPTTRLLTAQTLLRVRNALVLWGDISYDGLLYTVARTQEVDVATQLRLGVRMLQAQAHMCVQI